MEINMIFDCTTFNGEYDILEIRFNILAPFVDKFIIVESAETFSGNPKPLYWVERDKDRFEQWESKVIYKVVKDYTDQDILKQILEREDYVNEDAYRRSFYQKETIRKVLEEHAKDEDIVIYGDCDEIINPKILNEYKGGTWKLRQLNYSYYLNNRSSENWKGTIITQWKDLKDKCLNDLRAKPTQFAGNGGWHFSNLGGLEMIKRKLQSYDHTEANHPWVLDNLAMRMSQNTDFLGREEDYEGKPFTLWVEDTFLPRYVKENKEKWIEKGLWKS